jgi:DNA-binding response OmpR family regulator/DNA-binding CsgD family transcriptional regulator
MVEMNPAAPQPNILVADDTVEILTLMRQALEREDYKVRAVSGGQLALAAAQADPPDLILLDILMPDMDGLEVCRQLKANPATRDIPVIFMTALDAPADRQRGFEVGGVDYIPKPLHLREMLARVKIHVDLNRLQQQLKAHNELLEQRVQERTAQLAEANQKLQVEIERRARHEQETEHLFDLAREQSDQLRQLTTLLIQGQQKRQQALTDTLQQQIAPYVKLAADNLRLMQRLITEGAPAQAIDLLADHLSRTMALLDRIQIALREAPLEQDAEGQSLLKTPLLQLSAREREVLHLLVEGRSNIEIADLLFISAKTVSTHRTNVMQKLGANSLADLVRLTMRH